MFNRTSLFLRRLLEILAVKIKPDDICIGILSGNSFIFISKNTNGYSIKLFTNCDFNFSEVKVITKHRLEVLKNYIDRNDIAMTDRTINSFDEGDYHSAVQFVKKIVYKVLIKSKTDEVAGYTTGKDSFIKTVFSTDAGNTFTLFVNKDAIVAFFNKTKFIDVATGVVYYNFVISFKPDIRQASMDAYFKNTFESELV